MDVGRGHGELGGGKQGRWTGREKSCLADHGFYFSWWPGMTNVTRFQVSGAAGRLVDEEVC
jgi:hypothetical protein